MDKFIIVFSEADKNTLLNSGYELIKEPKQAKKKASTKKKDAKSESESAVVEKEEVKYWIFLNKSVHDMVFNSLESYAFTNTLTF